MYASRPRNRLMSEDDVNTGAVVTSQAPDHDLAQNAAMDRHRNHQRVELVAGVH